MMLLRNVNRVRIGHECGTSVDLNDQQSAWFMSAIMSVAQQYRPVFTFDCPSCEAPLQIDVPRAKAFLRLWAI